VPARGATFAVGYPLTFSPEQRYEILSLAIWPAWDGCAPPVRPLTLNQRTVAGFEGRMTRAGNPAESVQPCGIRRGDVRADDGSRTRDLWLGKPTLYQLSYVRA
jgi:hypothetical protein